MFASLKSVNGKLVKVHMDLRRSFFWREMFFTFRMNWYFRAEKRMALFLTISIHSLNWSTSPRDAFDDAIYFRLSQPFISDATGRNG